MKIKEYKNLNIFLNRIFSFFKERELSGALEQITDYDKVKKEILDSEYIGYTCSPSIEHYSIRYKINHKIEDWFVDLILFGKKEEIKNNSFLVDMVEKKDATTSFFSLSWHENKIPPFMNDFIDEDGMILTESTVGSSLVKVTPDMIMSFDDFEEFLHTNPVQKKLAMIEVE